MNSRTPHQKRIAIRIALELIAKDIDLCLHDRDYRAIQDRLMDVYLDIATLRTDRQDRGIK